MKKLRFLSQVLISSHLALTSFSLAAQEQEAVLKDLSGGMVSYPSINRIPDNSAAYIQNFLTDVEPLAVERNGYVRRDSTVLGGTKPAYGSWEFVDSSGNDWYITYSSRTFYKNTIGQTPTAFGLAATVDQIPDCAKNLGVIMCVNGTDNAWTFDGTSTAVVSGAPLGTHIEAWRTRFAIANIGGAKSTIRFSADGSATTWTLGGNPTDPFSIQIGGANDGDYVRCLVGAYQDSMIIGRKYDMWAMDGFDQADITLRQVSNNVGCIEPRTLQEVDGELVWLSARGLEAMNGRTIRNISEPIRNITDIISKNSINQRSNTQTSQSDWQAGTISPLGKLSTTVSPGDVTLSTLSVQNFTDTVSTDFAAGILTSLSTSTFTDSLTLTPGGTNYACTTGVTQTGAGCACYHSQSFNSMGGFILSSVTIHLSRSATAPSGNGTLSLKADSGGAPGTTLVTIATINWPDVTTSAGGTDYTFTLTPYALSANTRYWLTLQASGCQSTAPGICNGPSNIFFYDYTTNSPCNTTGEKHDDSDTTREANFSLSGTAYAASGNILSRTYDVGFTTNTWLWNWGVLNVDRSLPTGTAVSYQTQTSTSATGVFDALVPVAENATTTSTVREFIRYKASVTSTNQSTSPIINSITIPVGPFISTGGLFTSQLISVGSLITSWGPVTISNTQSSGTIVHQFGSTNTASVSAISNWTTIVNGGIPVVSTNPYAAFRSSFTSTGAGASLLLSDFQTTWNEGGVIPSPVAGVYDRRYWLSFTTSVASAPYLDTILVWQRTKTFTLFKGINAGSFTLWRDYFYFGNSDSTGYVYKYDTGNNDDGNAITSLIYSKSYDLGSFYRDKEFRNNYLQFLASPLYTSSFLVSYDLDQLGQNFLLGTVNLNEGTGQLAVKLPFSLSNPVQGREIQYKISKSGTGDRLKLHGLTIKYMLQEEQ